MAEELLEEYARRREPALRDRAVEDYLPFARGLARRYARRGIPVEDLEQVAATALVKAVDRFEPDRGFKFTTFAAPTIVGELKRHFRDHGWTVQVPRRLQELYLELGKTSSALAQDLGRSPTIAELAETVDADEEQVLEAMELGRSAYQGTSIEAAPGDDEDDQSIAGQLGTVDPELDASRTRASLRTLLAHLAPREKRILYLRFFEDLTQSEIAEDVGISQMHVSRLIRSSLDRLREIARDSGESDESDEDPDQDGDRDGA